MKAWFATLLILTSIGAVVACVGRAEADCEWPTALSNAYPPNAVLGSESLEASGWEVAAQSRGDLNGDALPDVVLVIDRIEPTPPPDHHESDPVRGLVFLTGIEGGRFRVAGASACALYRGHGFFMVEDNLKIRERVFVINQSTMMTAGSWGSTKITERWRLDNGTPRLIGFTNHYFMRNSGRATKSDQNLLTGRRVIESFNEFETETPRRKKSLNEEPRDIRLADFVLSNEIIAIDALISKMFPSEE